LKEERKKLSGFEQQRGCTHAEATESEKRGARRTGLVDDRKNYMNSGRGEKIYFRIRQEMMMTARGEGGTKAANHLRQHQGG